MLYNAHRSLPAHSQYSRSNEFCFCLPHSKTYDIILSKGMKSNKVLAHVGQKSIDCEHVTHFAIVPWQLDVPYQLFYATGVVGLSEEKLCENWEIIIYSKITITIYFLSVSLSVSLLTYRIISSLWSVNNQGIIKDMATSLEWVGLLSLNLSWSLGIPREAAWPTTTTRVELSRRWWCSSRFSCTSIWTHVFRSPSPKSSRWKWWTRWWRLTDTRYGIVMKVKGTQEIDLNCLASF